MLFSLLKRGSISLKNPSNRVVKKITLVQYVMGLSYPHFLQKGVTLTFHSDISISTRPPKLGECGVGGIHVQFINQCRNFTMYE
jgi:hypothetical protein